MKAFIKEKNFIQEEKEKKLKSLNWDVRKNGGGEHSDSDISISKVKSGDSFQALFKIRNEVDELIDPGNIGRLATCVDGNRVYFQACEDGHKLSRDKGRCYLRHVHYQKYMPFVGDYELQYEELLGLYYIKREEL